MEILKVVLCLLATGALVWIRLKLIPDAWASVRLVWFFTGEILVWGLPIAALMPFETQGTLVAAWVIGFAINMLWHKLGWFQGNGSRRETTQRGTVIVTAKEANKWLGKEVESAFSIGGVRIPETVENTHFLLSGAIGTGKSMAFKEILTSARARNHRALVADLGGEFVKAYYREGKDLILNPFDKRCAGKGWSPFAEMKAVFDAARLASSMIPDGEGETKEWNGYARTVLEGILERLFERGETTNQTLCFYALGATAAELADLCKGTPAAVYFQPGNERLLGSVRGILASYIKPLTYLNPSAGQDGFSVRKWATDSDNDAWLFISYREDQLAALRPMIAAQLDVAATAILSTEAELERRLWVSIDEFPSLGYINSIEPLLNKGRKFGVCAVLGLQSATAQTRSTYGKDKAQAILAGLGTWVVLKQPDAESAEYMSLYLGDEEARRMVVNESKNDGGSSSGASEQIVRQRAIMPSELQNLQNLQGIVNVAGPMPPAWCQIPITTPATGAASFQDVENARAMRIERPGSDQPPAAGLTFNV